MKNPANSSWPERQPSKRALTALACVLLALGWCVIWWGRVQPVVGYTMDDSFISFRYAQHLAWDGSITWNRGESIPTEGYTSLLWVWVMAAVSALGFDQVMGAKWISLAMLLMAALAVCAGTWWAGRGRPGWWLAAALGGSLFAAHGDLLLHMVSGMETAAAVFLTTVIAVLVTVLDRQLTLASGKSAATLFCLTSVVCLSALNRPESLLTSGLAACCLLWRHHRQWRVLWWWGLLPFAVAVCTYMAWRLARYGLVMPLPFYIKVGASGHLAGWPDVRSFVLATSGLWAVLCVGLWWPSARRVILPLLCMAVGHVVFFVFPEHIMGMAHRFLMPIWGLLCLAVAVVMGMALEAAHTPARRRATVAAGLVLLALVATGNRPREAAGMAWYRDGMHAAHIKLGQQLARYPGTHTIALGDAGAVSYYAGWPVLDTFGLNHRAIARARAAGAYDSELVLREQPVLLVFISRQCATFDPPLPHERTLMAAALSRGYQAALVYRFADNYHLQVFSRPDADGQALAAHLRREQAGLPDCGT